MVASRSVHSLDTAEASRLETAIGPEASDRLTIFPLHGISPEGACMCEDPRCRTIGKHPAIKWRDLEPGTKILRRGDGLGEGLGLVTGSKSGGIVVLDIDTKGGGFDSIQVLESALGTLPETLSVRSPSGGLHLYFWHPRRFQSNASALAPGVDVRAEGGMVVLPGSPHKAGGTYVVEDARPISMLPAMWADRLPSEGRKALPGIVPDVAPPVDPSTLRERLREAVKGRRGDSWVAWRAAVVGDPLLRLEGSLDGPAPLVIGVDEFINKSLIWDLVTLDEWHAVPAEDMATLIAPSLSHLRRAAEEAGTPSKWTPEHFGECWTRAAGKIAASRAEAARWKDALEGATRVGAAARESPTPFVIQLDDRYWLLDDRTPDLQYVGPVKASVLVLFAKKLWGDRRVLETESKDGARRDMTPIEIAAVYGAPVSGVVADYSRILPCIEDHTLVLPPGRGDVPAPVYDSGVAAWLDLLSLDLPAWLWWAALERTATSIPALVLVGGAHVGKSLLADGIARAAGLRKAGPLGRAMGRFNSILATSPILFSDEGIPRGERGQPMTQEFRALVTAVDHVTEVKGIDKPLHVRGSPRVILAANRIDRLFQNKGNLGSDDLSAILRRLYVVEILGDARIDAARAAAMGLGDTEGDPRRLARVAGHIRWIQTHGGPYPEPTPRAGGVRAELRRGGDISGEALRVLEDRCGTVDWIHPDAPRGVIWVRPDAWAMCAAVHGGAGPLMRAIAPYVRTPSGKFRSHPVTGKTLAKRERWAALGLADLAADGVDLDLDADPGTR